MRISLRKIDITPKAPCHMAAYNRLELSQGVLDSIQINTMALELGEKLLVYSVLDSLVLEESFVNEIVEECAKRNAVCAKNKNNINVAVTHTHSGPCYFKSVFEEAIVELELRAIAKEEIIKSIIDCVTHLEEAKVKYGYVEIEGYYGNRNNKAGECDKGISVLHFYNQKQELLGSFLNISTHPTILNHENYLLSNDLLGQVRNSYTEYTKSPCLITNGATGDVSTRFYRELSGVEELVRVGQGIFHQLIEKLVLHDLVLDSMDCSMVEYTTHSDFSQDPITQALLAKENLTKQEEYLKNRCEFRLTMGKIDLHMPSHICRMNDLFIITLPGDVVSAYGLRIKKALEPYKVMLVCYANAYCNYLVNEEQYGKYFETFISRCMLGESDKFIKKVIDAAKSLT